jgi:hypothetical protein
MPNPTTIRELSKRPSALVPFAPAAVALALVLGYVAVFGVDTNRVGDEGAPARLFQLTLAAQVVTMAVFAAAWLPRALRPTLVILLLQAAAAAIPIATILLLERII